jgi:hypothetical protein
MADNENKQPQVKQGAITAARLRVENFRGAYRDARFDNDGVSEEPVSPETAAALKSDFPNARVEVVRAKTEEPKQ